MRAQTDAEFYKAQWEKAEASREQWKTVFWLLASVVLSVLYAAWVIAGS